MAQQSGQRLNVASSHSDMAGEGMPKVMKTKINEAGGPHGLQEFMSQPT
jgi:hypothetical protein